jgi:hypothetical protein
MLNACAVARVPVSTLRDQVAELRDDSYDHTPAPS